MDEDVHISGTRSGKALSKAMGSTVRTTAASGSVLSSALMVLPTLQFEGVAFSFNVDWPAFVGKC